MAEVRVECLISRMIGDRRYEAGAMYALPPEQAAKYAAGGYFRILSDDPVTEVKMASAPDNKILRGRITKGLPARGGGAINLDGTPVTPGETMERP